MSGKYSVEDLLKLRASPLITKPANLAYIEEVLSAPEVKPQRPATRKGADELNGGVEGLPKRPLLDAHRKSTTDPDRLVLGPTRKSFASSNPRTGGKGSLDATEELLPTREKFGFDRFKKEETDKFADRRINGRFARNDPDGSADERPRRRGDEVEGDSRTRRDPDRKPKWASEDDGDKEGRPERQSRARLEQSWLKPSRGAEALNESRREGERGHGWRDKKGERAWVRPALDDDDPEWMDAPIEEEKQGPVRTQEDFQKWREEQQGRKAPAVVDDAFAQPLPPIMTEDKPIKTSGHVLDMEADDSMDKFFAKFNESKINAERPTTAKGPSKSKFASLFSPPPEIPQQTPALPPLPMFEQPAPPPQMQEEPRRPVSATALVDADQAGFARIMEMLNARGKNGSPLNQEAKSPMPHNLQNPQQPQMGKPEQPLVALFGQPQSTAIPTQTPQHRPQETRSPIDPHHDRQPSQKNNALLNLLQQAATTPKPTPPPPRFGGHHLMATMNENVRHHEHVNQSAVHRNHALPPQAPQDPSIMAMLGKTENGRGPTLDDKQSMQYGELIGRSHHGQIDHQSPLQHHGPSQDALLNLVRGFNPPQQPQPQAPPPGLSRPPPGLNGNRPQGWPHQPPPQQQPRQAQQPPPPPPPGMSGPPRNLPPQYAAHNMHQARPQQQQPPLQPPQRKYTGDFPQMIPPGFGPPPGFFAPPQGLSRPQFMDMYGNGNGDANGRGAGAGARGMSQGYR